MPQLTSEDSPASSFLLSTVEKRAIFVRKSLKDAAHEQGKELSILRVNRIMTAIHKSVLLH